MKTIGKLIFGIVILILGIVIGVAFPIKWIGDANEIALFSVTKYVWERTFDIINAILLLMTLLTAIFKEQILAMIYYPKFKIDNDDEYSEIVENTETGSRASSYEKIMLVQNVGNRPAKNCRLILDNISIKCESDYYTTDLNVKETVIFPLFLEPSNNQVLPQGSVSFSMFRILPKIEARNGIPERPMLFQIGDNKIEIMQGKTDYTIAFHIEAEGMQSSTQKIVVHWNGKWHSRKTEMKKVLSIGYVS